MDQGNEQGKEKANEKKEQKKKGTKKQNKLRHPNLMQTLFPIKLFNAFYLHF